MEKSFTTSERKRELLEQYLQKRSHGASVGEAIPRRAPAAVIPLTFAQQQVWLHAQLAPELPLYNEPFTVHRKGPLDAGALERALNEIIRRHEAWRTTFAMVEGEPVQVVHPPFEIKLPVTDLRHLRDAERVPAALRLATEDARRPFDLAKLPLVRAHLVRLAEEEYRLFVNCHHLIFDGVAGYQVFLPELVRLYRAFASSENSPSASSSPSLPELPFQYGDYAVWQRASLGRADGDPQVDYWKRQLGGTLPVLQLPADRPRADAESFRGAMQCFAVSGELSDGLRALSRQQGVTLFMTLLAALDTLLYRYSGQEDILVGSITSGRRHPGTEKLLGFFLNTVALRTNLTGDPTFCEVLERVRKTTVEALSNDDVPLDRVVRDLHAARDLGRNPLFRVLLSLEPMLSEVEPGWNLTPIDVETGTSKFDLCFVLDDRSEGLSGRLIYSTDLFDAKTISGLVECWQTLLRSVVKNPRERISKLSLLPESECRKQVVEFNETRKSYPITLAHRRFEIEAEKMPQAVAVKCDRRQLTYGELNQRANQLAHHLRSLGVGPEVPVALCVGRSVEMLVGILGVLKAGGAYVPLDPAYPRQRLQFMLDDCGASVVLTQAHLAGLTPSSKRISVIYLDKDWPDIDREPRLTPGVESASENLAYVIYTSGSTGGPKGVEVTHHNLAQSTSARLDYYESTGKEFLLLSSFAFDSSVATIFHALGSGGRLVLPGAEFTWEARQIADLIFENQISNILCIPSVYSELLQVADGGSLISLHTVVLAGESCPAQLVEMHGKRLPGARLFNEYGPTEATVWSTVYRCDQGRGQNPELDAFVQIPVPIGRPIANTQLFVLDRNRQLLPLGVPGELYIAGDGVARGYRNRPEFTAEKFLPLPFSSGSKARMYRSGDLVRYLPDGNLQFLGRVDEQVKIRGMRIELGEIEATLAAHPDVKEAAVAVEEEQRLLAYVVAGEEFATSGSELGAFLKTRLPNHMVPSVFRFLSALPRTPNGKLDRRALGRSAPDRLDMGRVDIGRVGMGRMNTDRPDIGRLDLEGLTEASDAQLAEPASPRDSIEARLLPIWQDVLGTESSDVTQNFFQLGGHSLLAAKLLYRIETEFKQPLTLAFVFQAPTIELMADWLRHPDQSLRARTIGEIQPEGSQLPLFWVRATPRFRLLAQKLGLDQPFLGLDIPFADATKLPTPYRIEDIASFLIKAMREVQPHGPYSLAGLCVNAVIAYEMAVQLKAQGEEIALLALLDGHNQAYYKNPLRDGRYTGRIKYHLSNIVHSNVKGGSAYILNRLEEARRKLERTIWQLSLDQGSNGSAGKMHNADAVVHPAFHRYEPRPYAGKMVLLQSSDWPTGDYFDFALGWKDVVREGIDFHRIPGNHPDMFREPNVGVVAEKLRSYLSPAGAEKRTQPGLEVVPAGSKF